MRAVILLALAGAAFGQVKVVKQSTPERALVFEVTIPAPRAAVWRAFTTSEGLSSWLSPGAVVDLRKGGEWTARYPGGKTGGGTILSFVAEQEITMAAMAPEQFPMVRAERTNARFEFKADGESTIVKLVQTGWKTGEEWDKAYEYLAQGNAQLLRMVRQRFISGPTDWTKVFGTAGGTAK